MVYLSINDNEVQAIQTGKSVFAGEKIIAAGRKEIEEGIVSDGFISKPDALLKVIGEIFSTAYPNPIEDDKLNVLVSDDQVVLGRFSLPADIKEDVLPHEVIEKAKHELHHNPQEYENFFKGMEEEGIQKILYTAMPTTSIIYLSKLFKTIGLTVNYISTVSFGIFELFHAIHLTNQKILYINLGKKRIQYLFFDSLGPVMHGHMNKHTMSLHKVTENIIHAAKEQKQVIPSRIIISGESSLEVHPQDVYQGTEFTAVKLNSFMDEILEKSGIILDTGGIPKIFFVNVLGGLLLQKNPSTPNFARDEHVLEKEQESIKQPGENFPEITPSPGGKKKSIMIIGFGFLVIIVLAIAGFIVTGNKSFSGLNFGNAPTSTPVPTAIPTLTPTPTIDPTLKREDLNVSVQNGTDKTGYAAQTAQMLEKTGYKNVAKGNADKDAYEKNVIKIKDSKKNYLPIFLNDIKESFSQPAVETLDEENKFDLIFILGRN